MAGTLTPLYRELMEAIIKRQSSIVGIAIAVKRARNVPGIEVDDKGHIINSTAVETEALAVLVDQYKALSGSIGLDFCRQATADFVSGHPDFPTPTFLA